MIFALRLTILIFFKIMKTIITVLLCFSVAFISFGQKNTCSGEEDSDVAFVSKCAIATWKNIEVSENKEVVTLTVSARRSRKVRPKESIEAIDNEVIEEEVVDKPEVTSANSIESKGVSSVSVEEGNNEIDILVRNIIAEEEAFEAKPIPAEVVLFNIVDEIPLFKKCENLSGIDKKKTCFSQRMSEHFSKNFRPERAQSAGKAFMQFTIKEDGSVGDVLVKGPKNGQLLVREIKRIISRLPLFVPGKHKGEPVGVKYSLPMNFTGF